MMIRVSGMLMVAASVASAAALPPEPAESRRAAEAAIVNAVDASQLRHWHDLLASEPHLATTPGDLREIERLRDAFGAMGLNVRVHDFWAYLPRPVSAHVEITAPESRTLVLKERVLDEDAYTSDPALDPAWNAYSGSGDVIGEVVYVNHGTKADFDELARRGVDLKGKIAIARYGGNFRGYKAKFAQAAGAAGLLIYTDPADIGGPDATPYPIGGYPNDTCIERGSILALDYPGDPLTPGIEATEHAERLAPSAVPLPRIPVQPINWSGAVEIMKRMAGDEMPDALRATWQGGLPLPYRLTGGPGLTVRLAVEQVRAVRRTANVIATLEGAVFPDEVVIIGCHHDAWGFGAADPLAGTIALVEAARVITAQAGAGHRPARTIIFAAWGAEEMGIIGSTEWVEGHGDLLKKAVAYINLDMASMGPNFGSSAAPSLRPVIIEAAGQVPQARASDGTTVLQDWVKRAANPADPSAPAFGMPGGGSDHVAFWGRELVASAGFGGGGSFGSSYHSIYDTLTWYRKVVGEDYAPARMVTQMAALTATKLATERLVPLAPAESIRWWREALRGIAVQAGGAGLLPDAAAQRGAAAPEGASPTPAPAPRAAATSDAALPEGWRALDERAEQVATKVDRAVQRARDAALAAGASDEQISRMNRAILKLERAWALDGGIPGRPWFRNSLEGPDRDSGYASWALPPLREAIEQRDSAALNAGLDRYGEILSRLERIADDLEATANGT